MAAGKSFVKFDLEQARRIAVVVRDYERTRPDRTENRAAAAGGRPVVNPCFMVAVTVDGGSSGTATTTCSWTYKVETLSGRLLGEGMTPDRRRLPNAIYTRTPDGTIGQAYFDEKGDLQLFDANELIDTTAC